MPRSVLQSNWYYSGFFTKEECDEKRWHRLECFELLDKHGFDQVPAGSVWSTHENLELLTKFCSEHVSKEGLMGMMQTSWERVAGPWMDIQNEAVKRIADAKAWYDANNK